MEINRNQPDPPHGSSGEPRFGKSLFEKPRGEVNSSDTNQTVEEQVTSFKEALRNIGGCCNDADCHGGM